MSGKKIVVIGGGFGGAAAAIRARSELDADHTVTLIDRKRVVHLCGVNPLLIVGERSFAQTRRSLGVLANRGVDFVHANVTGIDYNRRTISTAEGEYEYDYLVIAAGAEYEWGKVPGASAAYSFYSIDTARRLKRRLNTFTRGRVAIAVASTPYKCPPAPFETAMILDWFFKKRGVRKDIEIEVATPESGPMPVAGEDVASMINRSLDRKGIELKPGAAVTAVTGRGRMMEYSNGDRALVDLAITIPHHRMASLVADSPLIGDHGWVKVNPRTLETDHPGVFAIGDINAVPMAAGRGIPKAGVFAVSEGEIVGTNIAADINGTPTVDFPGDGYCFIGFSGEISASVKGNFTDPTGPKVMISRPSSRGMRAKERFERDWKRFRLS